MVDFQTQYKQYGYRYTAPEIRRAAQNQRDVNREAEPHLFKTPRVQVHDCRQDVMKEFSDSTLWEAFMFSHGLRKSHDDVCQSHVKGKKEEDSRGIKKPDKLLYTVGTTGSAKGHFRYPRGLAVEDNGDILVADTMNNRIQRLNRSGVVKEVIGEKGSGPGQFDEPTGITTTCSGDILVAEKKNKRIQVLNENLEYKYDFKTVDVPFSVSSDEHYNVAVGTWAGTVEIYRRVSKFYTRFQASSARNGGFLYVQCNLNNQEVIVSDPASSRVSFFTYTGKLLYSFEPASALGGLAFKPAGICLTPLGQIVICDTLNHMVALYTERGAIIQQLASPVDDVGSAQACAIGPEGHLVVVEYSVNKPHCVKILRYRECDCHRTTPLSCKQSSLPVSRQQKS